MIIPIFRRGKLSHQPTTATRSRGLPFLWRKNAYSTWWQVAMKWWKRPRRRVVTASLRQQHVHMPFHPFGPSEAAMIRQPPFASCSLRLLRLIDPGSMHWPSLRSQHKHCGCQLNLDHSLIHRFSAHTKLRHRFRFPRLSDSLDLAWF